MSVQSSRRPFTIAEYEQMVETGILRDDDRVELIEGEIPGVKFVVNDLLV